MHKRSEYTPLIEHINSCWKAHTPFHTSPGGGKPFNSMEHLSSCWQAQLAIHRRVRKSLSTSADNFPQTIKRINVKNIHSWSSIEQHWTLAFSIPEVAGKQFSSCWQAAQQLQGQTAIESTFPEGGEPRALKHLLASSVSPSPGGSPQSVTGR